AKKKTPGAKPGVSFVGRADVTFQRGTLLRRSLAPWEDAANLSPQHVQYVGMPAALQRKAPHDSHVTVARLYARVTHFNACNAIRKDTHARAGAGAHSIAPALRLADEKIAERLHARDRLELFRVDEERIERDRLGLAEQLHQPAVLLDQLVGQHRHSEPALAGAQGAEHVGDGEMPRCAALAVPGALPPPAR